MLTVTDAASERLATILDEEGVPEDKAIRLVRNEEGLGMQPDSERPGDVSFAHDGRTVLVLDEQLSELLTEETLDVQGGQLTLRRPGS